MNLQQETIQKTLRELSPQDFLSFGMHDVAYVREVKIDGQVGFAVHAADGTPLSVMDSMAEVTTLIHHNDLETVILH